MSIKQTTPEHTALKDDIARACTPYIQNGMPTHEVISVMAATIGMYMCFLDPARFTVQGVIDMVMSNLALGNQAGQAHALLEKTLNSKPH